MAEHARATTHVVVMGVSGSGKTTIAERLAARLGLPFADADAFHPPANKAKMRAGTALDDDDRRPWLAAIAAWLDARAQAGGHGVVTCSALKRVYRDRLRQAQGRVRFVHLTATSDVLAQRMGGRSGHFMPQSLLASQLATLEPLAPDEDGVTIATDVPIDEVVERALAALADGVG